MRTAMGGARDAGGGTRGAGRALLGAALALALVAAPTARADVLQDPEYDARCSAFKKVLKIGPEDPQPEAKAARGVVDALAGSRDARAFHDLFSALAKSSKVLAAAKLALDEVSEKHRQAMVAYFAWFEEQYRLTGVMPTTILVVHRDAIEAWKVKLEAAAKHHEVRRQIHDGLRAGLSTNLKVLDVQRDQVWKEAVEKGTKARDAEDRAAFATALGALGTPEAEAVLLKMETAEGKDPEALVATLDGLGAMRSPLGFARIRERVDDPRWEVAAAAVQAVRGYRNADVVPTLVKAASAKDERLADDAYDALFDLTGKHFGDDPGPWGNWWKSEGPEFLKRWSADPAERIAEIEKIAFADPAQFDVSAELACLLPTEPDPAVRKEILASLSIHKTYHARMALLRALKDERKEIRLAAIRGLAHMTHLSVPEALMKLVDDADEETLASIFQSLRALWGGEDEFSVTRPDRDEINRWWGLNKDRVVDQFLRLGAMDIAGGKPSRTEEQETHRERTFYGLQIRSSRVLFCVDNSLSMEEPHKRDEQKKKIEVAKEELARVLKTLPEGGTFGIVVFAGYPEIYETGMMPLTKKSREKALEWVKALPTHPGTNVYDTLELVFSLGTPKSPVKSADSPDTIYLVSDGDPTVGKYLDTAVILDFVRRENARRRVKIHAIGVGHDHNVDFLRTLAEEHGGTYVAR